MVIVDNEESTRSRKFVRISIFSTPCVRTTDPVARGHKGLHIIVENCILSIQTKAPGSGRSRARALLLTGVRRALPRIGSIVLLIIIPCWESLK